MVLLDRRRNQTGDTDPIATHFDRSLPSLGIEISRAQQLAVFFSQVENLSYFDAAISLHRARIATQARITGHRQANIGKRGWREIPLLVDINIVRVHFIGPSNRSLNSLNGLVHDDADFKANRSQKSQGSARGRLHPSLTGERQLATAQRPL